MKVRPGAEPGRSSPNDHLLVKETRHRHLILHELNCRPNCHCDDGKEQTNNEPAVSEPGTLRAGRQPNDYNQQPDQKGEWEFLQAAEPAHCSGRQPPDRSTTCELSKNNDHHCKK